MALMVLGAGASACSTRKAPLRPALEELASVGGPDGAVAFDLTVVGCAGHAEMPAGYASYHHPGLDRRNADAFNAEFAKVTAWYVPRWKALGWTVNTDGSATKRFDGTRLEAVIDVAKGTGYAIVVVKENGATCG